MASSFIESRLIELNQYVKGALGESPNAQISSGISAVFNQTITFINRMGVRFVGTDWQDIRSINTTKADLAAVVAQIESQYPRVMDALSDAFYSQFDYLLEKMLLLPNQSIDDWLIRCKNNAATRDAALSVIDIIAWVRSQVPDYKVIDEPVLFDPVEFALSSYRPAISSFGEDPYDSTAYRDFMEELSETLSKLAPTRAFRDGVVFDPLPSRHFLNATGYVQLPRGRKRVVLYLTAQAACNLRVYDAETATLTAAFALTVGSPHTLVITSNRGVGISLSAATNVECNVHYCETLPVSNQLAGDSPFDFSDQSTIVAALTAAGLSTVCMIPSSFERSACAATFNKSIVRFEILVSRVASVVGVEAPTAMIRSVEALWDPAPLGAGLLNYDPSSNAPRNPANLDYHINFSRLLQNLMWLASVCRRKDVMTVVNSLF